MFISGESKPLNLLIYYGWPNSFNSASNQWNNDLVAQNMAKYGIVILGSGLEDPSHGDHTNTQIIINRIQEINPKTMIFGYVTVNQSIIDFQTKASQWDAMGIHGIFMDEAGYDFGKTREEFNDRVNYVHNLPSSKICFANAWFPDNILGLVDDPNYLNLTFNPSLIESALLPSDWILLESFAIDTAATNFPSGYEPKAEWKERTDKILSLKQNYNINIACSVIIKNNNSKGIALYQFGFVAAMMIVAEAYGSSDENYASSSSTVKWWTAPVLTNLGNIWCDNPKVIQDIANTNILYRFLVFAKLLLNFTANSQSSTITIY
jgi:hypothetical protein